MMCSHALADTQCSVTEQEMNVGWCTHLLSSGDGMGYAFLCPHILSLDLGHRACLSHHPLPQTVITATACLSRGGRFWMPRSRAHAGLRSTVTRGGSLFGLVDTSDPSMWPFICGKPQKASQCAAAWAGGLCPMSPSARGPVPGSCCGVLHMWL